MKMDHSNLRRCGTSNQRGYTLVEVLVAATLLALAVGAAAALAFAMSSQEESNAKVARAINLQEQAARLYQLGMAPNSIYAILPPVTNVTSISFITSSLAVTGVGSVEKAECAMIFHSGQPLTSDEPVPALRTNNIVIIRPSIR